MKYGLPPAGKAESKRAKGWTAILLEINFGKIFAV
jgi:hypothetical protein